MFDEIIVSKDISAAADKIDEMITSIIKDINAIKEEIGSIGSIWVGEDANSFVLSYDNSVINQFLNFVEILNRYERIMRRVPAEFELLDDRFDRPINF